MNSQTYFIVKNGQTHGPLYDSDLLQWLNAGQIGIADSVLRQSDNKWIPVAELFPNFAAPARPPRPRRKNRSIIGCLATILMVIIFCGCTFISEVIFLIRCESSGRSYGYCSERLKDQRERDRMRRR